MTIIGEIPAREGSKRVPAKNLRQLDGQPLIRYAIDAAKGASLLTDVYVNTESEAIGSLAREAGVRWYRRPAELASDAATQDQFNYDFIQSVKPDVLVMVNPVAPLIEAADIDAIVRAFLDRDVDTLITVREEYAHAYCEGRPVNFSPQRQLPRTQDLPPLQICSWSVAVWRASAFVSQYERDGHAAFCGRVGFFPIDRFKALKISYEDDFRLAEAFLAYRRQIRTSAVPALAAEAGGSRS